jgi:glucokinase
VPGPIDFKTGTIIKAPNIAGMDNLPITDRISTALGRPVVLENDANAAAFAEYWVGAAKNKNVRNIVMLTLGTGIGTGLIIDGVIIHGSFDHGAEGGHMIVRPSGRLCGCGQRGCIEAYASASHTADRAQDALDAGNASSLGNLPRPLTSKQVFDAAENGDELATGIINETAEMLGITCINICRLLDPQMILFAGGMALAGDFLLDRIRIVFQENRWHVASDPVQIALAQVGNDAGLIGAAGVAWDAHQQGRL